MFIHFILCGLIASAPLQADKEILLQFSPETDATAIAKIIATDKVILDAAPAEQNAEKGWRQLPLPTSAADAIVVTPSNTQARESTPEQKPAKVPRLLTGILLRKIAAKEPYPIRLKSPEGRFIAYVDFSGIFIPDLTPYKNQKVYLRGEVHPLKGDSSKLVIYAQDIRLAE